MTGHQQAVMWLGLLLILTRLFTTSQWAALRGTVNNGSQFTGGTSGGSPDTSTGKKVTDAFRQGVIKQIPGHDLPVEKQLLGGLSHLIPGLG